MLTKFSSVHKSPGGCCIRTERERRGETGRERGVRLGDAGGGRRGCIKTEEHTTAGETQEKKKNTTNLNLNTQLE